MLKFYRVSFLSVFLFFLLAVTVKADLDYLALVQKQYLRAQKILDPVKHQQALQKATQLSQPLLFDNNYRVHFEVGHLYYQSQNYLLALYNYRQAQFLNPLLKNVKASIIETRKKLANNPPVLSDSIIGYWQAILSLKFISPIWLIGLFFVFYLIFWVYASVLLFFKKKISIKLCLLFFFFFISVGLGFFIIKWNFYSNFGIVATATNFYEGPGFFYSSSLEKNVGQEFQVVSKYKNWIQVRLETQNTVWVQQQKVLLY